MFLSRFERAEQLRVQVEDCDRTTADVRVVAELAHGDAAAVQTAWSSFVPYLAHPVMAPSATGAMALLDAAATVVVTRSPAAA